LLNSPITQFITMRAPELAVPSSLVLFYIFSMKRRIITSETSYSDHCIHWGNKDRNVPDMSIH